MNKKSDSLAEQVSGRGVDTAASRTWAPGSALRWPCTCAFLPCALALRAARLRAQLFGCRAKVPPMVQWQRPVDKAEACTGDF